MSVNGVSAIRKSSCPLWHTWYAGDLSSQPLDSCDQKVCPLKELPPPGTLTYEQGEISIYEVDGEEHKLYTQNLSLFAKLFLDNKSVFYDVTTFRYYIMTYYDPTTAQRQIVGFFSKEKMSWDNNNVACILVFPPWQRRGLGQILMGVSYELSRGEGRLGGPEKRMSIYPDMAIHTEIDCSAVKPGSQRLSCILECQHCTQHPVNLGKEDQHSGHCARYLDRARRCHLYPGSHGNHRVEPKGTCRGNNR